MAIHQFSPSRIEQQLLEQLVTLQHHDHPDCMVPFDAAEGNNTERLGGGNPVGIVDFVTKHFAAATK